MRNEAPVNVAMGASEHLGGFAKAPRRRALLLLLAEQAEALLLVFVFVLLALSGARLGGERDGGRQRVSTPGDRRAGAAALDVRAVCGAGVQDGLDPGTHLLLRRHVSS